MEQREQLILDLQSIKQKQFKLSEKEKADDYVNLMLQYIGDPEPELRDHLIYKTFYRWILVEGYFNKEGLRHILSVVLDENHLFYCIGNEEDDTVFRRSFSVLVLALILAYHRKKPFLGYDEFLNIKDSLIKYYQEEKDLRSYVKVKGWADAVSHGADALDELAACKESSEEIYYEVLEVLKGKLLNQGYSFYEEEDERITCAVATIIKSQLLSDEFISSWIEWLVSDWQIEKNRIVRINIKNFLRSLYFRLIHTQGDLKLVNNVFNAETKVNSFI